MALDYTELSSKSCTICELNASTHTGTCAKPEHASDITAIECALSRSDTHAECASHVKAIPAAVASAFTAAIVIESSGSCAKPELASDIKAVIDCPICRFYTHAECASHIKVISAAVESAFTAAVIIESKLKPFILLYFRFVANTLASAHSNTNCAAF
jgi:hypothetical protein